SYLRLSMSSYITTLLFFFLTLRPPPSSTLFPYTTLFRSVLSRRLRAGTMAEQIVGVGPVGNDVDAACASDRNQLRPELCLAEVRSEEHTSELQSRSDLVCRLLLEKKKKKSKSNLVRSERY